MPLTRARFTVAHEIGHFLIERATGYRPESRSDYWQLEALCDAFAGKLLLPDPCMPKVEPSDGALTPLDLLDVLAKLTRQDGLSMEATARRLYEHARDGGVEAGFGLLRAWRARGRPVDKRRPDPIAEADWIVGDLAGLGRRSRLRSDHELFALVDAALVAARRPAALAETQSCTELGAVQAAVRAVNSRTLLLAMVGRNVPPLS